MGEMTALLTAVGDAVATKPFGFNPSGVFAIDGLHFHPVALHVNGSKQIFFFERVNHLGTCRRRSAETECLSPIVTCGNADARVVDVIARA